MIGNCSCCGYETDLERCTEKIRLCRYCMSTNLGLTVTEPDKYGDQHLLASAIGWIANDQRVTMLKLYAPGKSGRKPKHAIDVTKVLDLRRQNKSWREVSKLLGVPVNTLRYAVREHDKVTSPSAQGS